MLGMFSGLTSNQKHLQRAVDTVLEGRVKKHIFAPSGRAFYTVVGRNGDEFIDKDEPFCSCQQFFFRVLAGREKACYHLLAGSIAIQTNRVMETVFHDEEFRYFLALLSLDILSRSGDKEDKESFEPSDSRPR